MTRNFICCLFFIIIFSAPAAIAGRTCESRTPTAIETAKALDLAQRVAVRLEALDVQVAVIARIGSDQSARGMRYTHLGLVQRDHPKGRWINKAAISVMVVVGFQVVIVCRHIKYVTLLKKHPTKN